MLVTELQEIFLKSILKFLPGKHFLLNSKIDGTFPNHHPDPTDENNLKQLKKKY